MNTRIHILGTVLVLAAGLLAIPQSAAGVSFFVNPDGQLATADPGRDLAFQAALSGPMYELNFADYGHNYVMEPSPLMAGSTVVRPNLLNAAGGNAADLAVNGNRLVETYPFVPEVAGIMGGGADGAALLSRTYAGNFADAVGAAMEFTFSQPVQGFGLWLMDDVVEENGYVLKITESGGATWTSSMLDSGNGKVLAIEGFIGAVSGVGITKAVIEQQTLAGAASSVDFFYVDHVQVGSAIPEPATLVLLAASASLLLKRKNSVS